MNWLFAHLLKGLVLLAAALFGSRMMRSYAARHLCLLCGLLGLLALPGLSLWMPSLLPSWVTVPWVSTWQEKLHHRWAQTNERVSPTASELVPFANPGQLRGDRASAGSQGVHPGETGTVWILFLLTLSGTLLLLVRGVIERRALLRAMEAAEPVMHPASIMLLSELRQSIGLRRDVLLYEMHTSGSLHPPLTHGTWRPRIVLPKGHRLWTRDRLRAVLLHELSHVQRFDCLTQGIARIACAANWFNPLVFVVERHLRQMRELAADAAVLRGGVRATTYAEDLLEFACGRRRVGVAALSESPLAQRIKALLLSQGPQKPLGGRQMALVVMVFVALVLPLSGVFGAGAAKVSPVAQGTPKDQSPAGKNTQDPALQAIAADEVRRLRASAAVEKAAVIAIDPGTSAPLAIASGQGPGEPEYASATALIPGSTVKGLTIALALDRGAIDESLVLPGKQGASEYQGATFRDATPHGNMRLGDALAFSSNVAALQIYQKLGKEALHQGFIDLRLLSADHKATEWSDKEAAHVAIGTGMLVTPLQVARAYGVLANGGRVAWNQAPILKKETVNRMLSLLEGTVTRQDGTGRGARLAGYRVAGKTGTSSQADGKVQASFVGLVPVQAPRLVLLVSVLGPSSIGSGGGKPTEAFARAASAMLAHLKVPKEGSSN